MSSSSKNLSTTHIQALLAGEKGKVADTKNIDQNTIPASSLNESVASLSLNSTATAQSSTTQLQNLQGDESKTESVFSYYPLNRHFSVSTAMIAKGDYVAMLLPGNKDFISLTYTGKLKNPDKEGSDLFTTGLKFHISLIEPDNQKFELSKGWEIVSSILMANQASCKLIREGHLMQDVPTQRGKVVTVYVTADKNSKDWQAIFQEMTEKLTAAEISPGYKSPGTGEKPERVLNGCNYVTYRYFDEEGRVKRLRGQEKIRISNMLDNDDQIKEEIDPIKKLEIKVANQLGIPEWEVNEEQSNMRKTF